MRNFVMKLGLLGVALCLTAPGTLFGQYTSQYPDIPIVDVHTHPARANDVANFVKISDALRQTHGSNLAFWIGLSEPNEETANEMMKACDNRILFAVGAVRPHRGLTVTADEVIAKVQGGRVGLKIWFGPAYRVLREGEEGITRLDDPKLGSFFAALEREKMLMASLHIADPNGPFQNRQEWLKDPVYFWEQIRAFENVVAKYPDLTFVAAHGAWLVCQDAQIDYLRYMFSTYPNLYTDLAATFQYMPFVDTENLRDFCVEYQDRLLYGTDGGRVADATIDNFVRKYANTFEILETDHIVEGSFFGDAPVNGLNLPREVLEKIYYKNAQKLYPGLKEAME